jgi:hypothetical protein
MPTTDAGAVFALGAGGAAEAAAVSLDAGFVGGAADAELEVGALGLSHPKSAAATSMNEGIVNERMHDMAVLPKLPQTWNRLASS